VRRVGIKERERLLKHSENLSSMKSLPALLAEALEDWYRHCCNIRSLIARPCLPRNEFSTQYLQPPAPFTQISYNRQALLRKISKTLLIIDKL